MRPGLFSSIVISGLVLGFAPGAFAEEGPDPNLISIRNVRAEGTGCQPGTVSSTISPDGRVFSVLFDNYQANAGGGNLRADKKTCEIQVTMIAPSGWQFSLFSADYRGFAAADSGATAIHEVVYSFDAVSNQPPAGGTFKPSFSAREFRGPYNAEYSIHNELPAAMLAWSPCNTSEEKTLRINTALLARVLMRNSTTAKAMLTLDSADGAFDQRFGIKWRQCSVPTAPTPPAPAPRPTPPVPPASPVPPVPQPPVSSTAVVYRFFNGRDNLMTTDVSEGRRLGFGGGMPMFRVFTTSGSSVLAPLFRCFNPNLSSHFVSRDSGCEGARSEGILGFVSTGAGNGMLAIARYTNRVNPADRLVVPATAPGDRGNYRFEGFLGFALPPR